MRVTVLYFAACRERAGRSTELVELPAGTTAAGALGLLCQLHPPLAAIADRLRLAIDQEFVAGEKALREGCELALIPPVSGGAEQR